ncbi:DMT family transporter [Pseudalkalibacillus hwajinpoensis]|uniref:Multidrug efflux SMR transporter n=1 Tax=Guptibacillus hwajinpoensis TaxID=208199 RepID=A0A4U1MNY1_9BACL|nr:multidrug efflux SMR transporter [Pseudalkalibacillus hwajinpoensis]TKD72564.1 multidrug efflux SMR transporter [Pseudalkalibacillus hwajinpoensis]
MAWIALLIAGLGEVGGVICLKLSEGFTKLKPSVFTILFGGLSFFMLSLSLKALPIGTAYAIWTGIGSAGSVLIGMYWFKEPKNRMQLVLITCVIISVVGLRIVEG